MSNNAIDISTNYVVLNKIGSSTFSEIYLIKEKSTGDIFTAKFSLKSLESSNTLNNNLAREIITAKQLNHPSVLQYIGYSPTNFHNDPKPVVISQFMPNKSLENILYNESNTNISSYWNDTRKLINIYGIASAMSYLHSHGIIHGYLYPTNILMDDHMFPKVTDYQPFNLHESNSDTINTQTSIYIAPELFGNSNHSKEGDVYAFSIIVYEIITNEKPFNNLNFFEVFTKVASGNRPEISAKISEPYKKLIEKCWSQNPSNRPSFEEIVKMLRSDKEFITDKIDRRDYENYIEYLDEYMKVYEESHRSISIEEFIESKIKIFKPIRVTEEATTVGDQTQSNKKETSDKQDKNKNEDLLYSTKPNKHSKLKNGRKEADLFGTPNQNEPIDLLDSTDQKMSNNKSKNKSQKSDKLDQSSKQDELPEFYLQDKKSGLLESLVQSEPIDVHEFQNKPASYFNSLSQKEPVNLIDGQQNESSDLYDSVKQLNQTNSIDFLAYPNIRKPVESSNQSDSSIYLKSSNSNDSEKQLNHTNSIDLLAYPNIRKPAESSNQNSQTKPNESLDPSNSPILLKPSNSNDSFLQSLSFEPQIHVSRIRQNESLDTLESSNILQTAALLDPAMQSFTPCNLTESDRLYDKFVKLNNGNEVSKKEAMNYLRMSLDKGNTRAMNSYGLKLFKGDGVKVDKIEAARYFKMAMDRGDPDGMFNYASSLFFGEGIMVNRSEAVHYFKILAIAMNNYGILLLNGIEVQKDISKGVYYIKRLS